MEGGGGADVVEECVKPHVGHVFLVEGQGNAPGQAGLGAGDAQVHALGTLNGVQEVLAAELRGDHLRVVGDVLLEPGDVLAEVEVPVFLLQLDDLSPFRTEVAVLAAFLLREELLLAHGVETLVGLLVQAALVLQVGQNLAHASLVARVGGRCPAIVRNAQALPERDELLHHHVRVLLGFHAGGLGLLLHLLAVLVHACEVVHVFATHSVPASQDVRQYLFIGVPDVRGAVRVVDCCCDVEHSARIVPRTQSDGKRNRKGPASQFR